jgi:hypothetical protein
VPPKRTIPILRNLEPKILGKTITLFLFNTVNTIPSMRLIAGLNTASDTDNSNTNKK